MYFPKWAESKLNAIRVERIHPDCKQTTLSTQQSKTTSVVRLRDREAPATMRFIVQKMATASLLSSSLFISKPSSPSSLFLYLPVKRFVSSSAQFRQRYGAVVSATSVATEPAKTQSVSQNGNVEQAQMTAVAEKVVLPTNESNEQLLRIRHTVSFGICEEKEDLI